MLDFNPIAQIQNQLSNISVTGVLIFLGITIGLIILFSWLLRLLDTFRLLKMPSILLELTPPATKDKTPIATEQLFAVLHGFETTRTLIDKVLRRKVVISLEVVSSRDAGIRYIIRIPKVDEPIIRQTIASYLPEVHIKKIKDFLKYPSDQPAGKTVEFKQKNHFAYPLRSYDVLAEQDPIAYITGSMTKLSKDELIVFQLVISPAKVSEASRIDKKILANKEARSTLKQFYRAGVVLRFVYWCIKIPFTTVTSFINGFFLGYGTDRTQSSYRPNQTVSPAEQDLIDSIHDKLTQPLFKANVRMMVRSDDRGVQKRRLKGLRTALAAFSVPQHQKLAVRKPWLLHLTYAYRSFMLRHRLPSLVNSQLNVLSVAELSSLYHFPHSIGGKTENVVKSLSRTLPSPVSQKGNTNFDIVLGDNNHLGTVTPIGLTEAERERHLYIIGGTGNGKTTMLLYGIVQDIKAGKGVAVVDPHGDLAKTILEHIPPERIKDVIYFDPDDVDYPICVNLLELPPGLKGSALEREKDRTTESVISVFRKIFSDDDTGGHRIEYILRNTIQTALTLPDPTIFTIFELLTNDDYRKQVTNQLPAGTLKNFWKNELGKAGNMQRVKMSQGVTSKIGRFEFSVATKRVMGQAKSSIDFDNIFSSGKILICNFSKGRLGEDTSALFGTAILAKLQVAANRRDRLTQAQRTPFYLYVDEFQNFATMPFVQMLSEARKYKLFLTMAEQSTSQQEEQRMVNIILANVGTVVCFRTGSPVDEHLVLPLFQPFIEAGEIANLPSFSFYIRIAALQPQEPMSGETLLLEDNGSKKTAKQVKAMSRKHYATKYEEVRVKKVEPIKSGVKQAEKKSGSDEDQPLDV